MLATTCEVWEKERKNKIYAGAISTTAMFLKECEKVKVWDIKLCFKGTRRSYQNNSLIKLKNIFLFKELFGQWNTTQLLKRKRVLLSQS